MHFIIEAPLELVPDRKKDLKDEKKVLGPPCLLVTSGVYYKKNMKAYSGVYYETLRRLICDALQNQVGL